MKLEWQQRQLLKILDDLDAYDLLDRLVTHLKRDDSREYFQLEGIRPLDYGSTGDDFIKKYPTEFVYPLVDSGYIGIKDKGGDAYDLWITPEGIELVKRRFREP